MPLSDAARELLAAAAATGGGRIRAERIRPGRSAWVVRVIDGRTFADGRDAAAGEAYRDAVRELESAGHVRFLSAGAAGPGEGLYAVTGDGARLAAEVRAGLG